MENRQTPPGATEFKSKAPKKGRLTTLPNMPTLSWKNSLRVVGALAATLTGCQAAQNTQPRIETTPQTLIYVTPGPTLNFLHSEGTAEANRLWLAKNPTGQAVSSSVAGTATVEAPRPCVPQGAINVLVAGENVTDDQGALWTASPGQDGGDIRSLGKSLGLKQNLWSGSTPTGLCFSLNKGNNVIFANEFGTPPNNLPTP